MVAETIEGSLGQPGQVRIHDHLLRGVSTLPMLKPQCCQPPFTDTGRSPVVGSALRPDRPHEMPKDRRPWQGVRVGNHPEVPQSETPRLHRAARIEDAVHRALDARVRRRGWVVTVVPYTGYGAPGWVRVMARVLLTRLGPGRKRPEKLRGWRSFTTLPVKNALVLI